MSSKKYTFKTSCPQCGCSAVTHLTADEIKERFGDVPNIQMECGECMEKYLTEMKTACPAWDEECKSRE